MKVLHAFNLHRSGGGASLATLQLVELQRSRGFEVGVFERASTLLEPTLAGRLQAGTAAFFPGEGVREFSRLLDDYRPDLVHTHELFPLVSPWILPECTQRSIPVIMTCNDYHLTCPARTHIRNGVVCTACVDGSVLSSVVHNCRRNVPESIAMAAYCMMVNSLGLYRDNVDHYIAPSAFTASWLCNKLNIDRQSMTVVPTQVPTPEHPAKSSAGRYAAFAGRFVPEKGIDVLLQAAGRCSVPVELSRNRASFVDVTLPSATRVVVTDTREELDAFYRAARMVVVPSVWFETFGLVAAEAMALGIPVIASRFGALADLIEDGVDGLLFEAGNSKDLAEKMQWVWSNPTQADVIGARARQKAAQLWSSDAHFRNTAEVYETVLHNRRKGASA